MLNELNEHNFMTAISILIAEHDSALENAFVSPHAKKIGEFKHATHKEHNSTKKSNE